MTDTNRDYEPARTDTPLPQLMTVPQVAEHLAVSRATIYRLVEDGLLTPIRVRDRIRLDRGDVRELIERRRAEGSRTA
jgi:excisionase family DNA binding protein